MTSLSMDCSPTQTKVGFVAKSICWLVVCVFVAQLTSGVLKTGFQSVTTALSDSTPVTNHVGLGSPGGPVWGLLVIAIATSLAVGGVVFLARVIRSNEAIQQCSRNGTVILEPDFKLALTRYLFSNITVDLSRTDFKQYSESDFPVNRIRGLIELRIRDAVPPEGLLLALRKRRSLKRVNFSDSKLTPQVVEELLNLENVELILDRCVEHPGE